MTWAAKKTVFFFIQFKPKKTTKTKKEILVFYLRNMYAYASV